MPGYQGFMDELIRDLWMNNGHVKVLLVLWEHRETGSQHQ